MDLKNIIKNKAFIIIFSTIMCLYLVILLIRTFRNFHKNIRKFTIQDRGILANKPYTIDKKLLPKNLGHYEWTFSLWIYVNDWKYKYNEPKHIFHLGEPDASSTFPGVWIYPQKNDIGIKFDHKDKETRYTDGKLGQAPAGKKCVFPYKWNWKQMKIPKPTKITNELRKIGVKHVNDIPETLSIHDCETTKDKYSDTGYCTTEVDEKGYSKDIKDFGSCNIPTMNALLNKHLLNDEDICNIKNIPLRQWFHLVISIYETSVNIYINGKLHRSCPLENIPKFKESHLYITQNGGFSGAISQFRMFPKSLKFGEITKIYKRGPNNTHLLNIPNLNICKLCSKL